MDKSINRTKKLIADDDTRARIGELDSRIKQLNGKPANKPKKPRGRKTAGNSFDSSIMKSIQRLQPKRGRK